MIKMFTNEQKVKFVEDAINEFTINPKFRDMLKWLIEETDKTYDALREKEWKEFWDNMDNPPRMKPKCVGKFKLSMETKGE